MGYSFLNPWVSPYTYASLMARTAPAMGGAANIWRPRMTTLFLDLTIDRSRQVFRRPSFHFPAVPNPGCGDCRCGFSVEFLDACHGVLGCHLLHDDCCSCGPLCWPRSFHAELPLPVGARWLTVWEGCAKLYEECIPDPPTVSLDCNSAAGDNFRLDWAAVPAAGSWQRAEDLWFLVALAGYRRLLAWADAAHARADGIGACPSLRIASPKCASVSLPLPASPPVRPNAS